jgi:hypothetical protein
LFNLNHCEPTIASRGTLRLKASLSVTVESGWLAIKVDGALDFGLTGVLLSVARQLAAAGVSTFALSTYDTDCVLVKESTLPEAVVALSSAGHRIG